MVTLQYVQCEYKVIVNETMLIYNILLFMILHNIITKVKFLKCWGQEAFLHFKKINYLAKLH